ncbi:MAG: sulfur relay protein DsrC [Gammaproteobacteria bacterium]|nr:MAG: sulfur relay protein DsrC [Gammaproteobacteria bacterium]
MLWLSEILIQDHDLTSFTELQDVLQQRARDGVVLFGIDVKPPFHDTPADWEVVLESTFTART